MASWRHGAKGNMWGMTQSFSVSQARPSCHLHMFLFIVTGVSQVPSVRDLMGRRLSMVKVMIFNSTAGFILPGGWE